MALGSRCIDPPLQLLVTIQVRLRVLVAVIVLLLPLDVHPGRGARLLPGLRLPVHLVPVSGWLLLLEGLLRPGRLLLGLGEGRLLGPLLLHCLGRRSLLRSLLLRGGGTLLPLLVHHPLLLPLGLGGVWLDPGLAEHLLPHGGQAPRLLLCLARQELALLPGLLLLQPLLLLLQPPLLLLLPLLLRQSRLLLLLESALLLLQPPLLLFHPLPLFELLLHLTYRRRHGLAALTLLPLGRRVLRLAALRGELSLPLRFFLLFLQFLLLVRGQRLGLSAGILRKHLRRRLLLLGRSWLWCRLLRLGWGRGAVQLREDGIDVVQVVRRWFGRRGLLFLLILLLRALGGKSRGIKGRRTPALLLLRGWSLLLLLREGELCHLELRVCGLRLLVLLGLGLLFLRKDAQVHLPLARLPRVFSLGRLVLLGLLLFLTGVEHRQVHAPILLHLLRHLPRHGVPCLPLFGQDGRLLGLLVFPAEVKGREDHPFALHAPHLALLHLDLGAPSHASRPRQGDSPPLLHILRASDNLVGPVASVDLAHLELVRVRVVLRR
mmetsp:Transcript_5568/g.20075  ORF Transcript_5568/g.20075 Transcript_5568/m.20075 type:complete len:547 (-) Transcript_5568:131-1771(-)